MVDIEVVCVKAFGEKRGRAIAQKLKSVGIYTAEELAYKTVEELQKELGEAIGLSVLNKLIEVARECIGITVTTADQLYERRQNVQRITTGSKSLDRLLGGGIELGALYELAGEYGSGKTQICHQLCVNIHLPPEKGGLETPDNPVYAAYIDTEGTFRPERIIQMAKALGLDPQDVLKKTFYAHAVSTDHQLWLIKRVGELIKSGYNIKLVIVDSITALFRAEYTGLGKLAERQQKLNRHVRELLKLCTVYNVAVVVTNQVMAKPDALGSYLDMVIPVGGHVLAHAITYRLLLRRPKGEKGGIRVARLIDAPDKPEQEVTFQITENGIR